MHILLHSDPNTDGGHRMSEYLTNVVQDALKHFGERITRVEAHLSDSNSLSKTSVDGIHCTLEARLVGLEPVVVKEQAGTAHQAIEGAVRKLKRAITAGVEKLDSQAHRAQAAKFTAVVEPD